MAVYKNQNTELDKAIARLEMDRDLKLEELKEQLATTYESIKPVNILRETVEDFNNAPDLKSNLLQIVVSIAGGYLSKKLLLGKSNSFFKKIAGYILQYGMTSFIAKKTNPNP
ncbi:hypothetical protein ABS764_08560 [Flavobacterium sp. ST-87]|uniref:Uncharacterized protein n=1 Tax=Flavobacterium plantiphilum TaxID=3163297 RepID=A0ABW8XUS6_9FLAO